MKLSPQPRDRLAETVLPTFAPGDRVTITDGLSAGRTGVVVGPSRVSFGRVPTYAVNLGGLEGTRFLRADFLRRAA